MTAPATPSDETLVAFLDGELGPAERRAVQDRMDADAGVAARLDALKGGDLPFAAAFDALLAEAPLDRLRAMVPGAVGPGGARRRDRRWVLAAACLAAGVVLGRSAGVPTGGGDDGTWRDAVARYMALYAPETLRASGAGPDAREMARLSDGIGVDLSLAKVDIPGVPIRRAQMLRHGDAPLVQIAYLDEVSGPLAFCLIRRQGGSEGPRTERRLGMMVVYWSSPTHAFLVIGHGGAASLRRVAEGLRARVAG